MAWTKKSRCKLAKQRLERHIRNIRYMGYSAHFQSKCGKHDLACTIKERALEMVREAYAIQEEYAALMRGVPVRKKLLIASE